MNTVTVQYRISGDGSTSIAASIEDGIASGRLAPGQALPSVRRLAADLGVSPSTVATAYRDLKHRGIVVTRDRSRTVVGHRPPLLTRPAIDVPTGSVDLASGNPDAALLPSLEAAARRLTLPVRLYAEDTVVPEFEQRVRRWFEADGISADHLAVVSGALDGIERVLLAHLRPGDRVAVEDPGYTGVLDLARALGLDLVAVAVDDDGPRPEAMEHALAAGVAAVVVTPRAQNPYGAALSADREAALRSVLDAHPDVLVIEDDHATEIAGRPPRTIVGERRRWAVVRSLTKSLGPDLRIAVLAGDEVTVTRVLGRQRLGSGWVSHVLQRLALVVWDQAERDGMLATAAEAYTARRDALIEALAGHGLAAHGRSGLNVWVPVPAEGPVLQGLLQRGWAVQPGDLYRLESAPAVRVTTATLAPRDAERLAADLAELLRSGGRTRRA